MIYPASILLIAQMADLPADLQTSLDRAIESDDAFIIKTVSAEAIAQNPDYSADIEEYMLAKLIPMLEAKQKKEAEESTPKEPNFWSDGWSGNLEGGLLVHTGNSENQSLNTAAKITKKMQDWEHILEVSGANHSSHGVRSGEEYRANLQTRNNISDKDYLFAELDWVKDRYSSYDFKLSELLGYGYKFYDSEEFKLSAEIAAGIQQAELQNGDSEDGFVEKISGDLDWAINDYLNFLQHLSIENTQDALFSISDSALKTKITDSLALKFAYNIEHTSDVLAGTEKLNTKTTFNVLYDF